MMSSSRQTSGDKSEDPIAAANATAVGRTTSPAPAQPGEEPVARRRRGRPPGSGSGSDMFSIHQLTVNTGENVYSKIWSTQKGKKVVWIVSAGGIISKVRFQRPEGTEDFEGKFYIMNLSGLVMPQHVAVAGAGGISISLTADDGSIFGGAVAGLLIAASDVHVTLGSFNLTAKNMVRSSSAPVIKNLSRGGRGGGASSSRSQGSGRPVHGQLALRKT